ncbi:MAG TPA: V-type ATP synthase subunit C [Clostridiales bacterium]|nr:V-type ATP synthase subunit C [Clostridiales bacterium]
MNRSDFIQGVTRTKVIETRLLSQDKINRMIESNDVEEALRLLNESEYSDSFKGVLVSADYEKILSNELIRIYDLMRDVSADPVVVDLLALKYDYHNMKVMVKEKIYKKDLSDLYISVSVLAPDFMKEAYTTQDFRQISKEFKTAIDAVEEDFEKSSDPQRIDFIFDEYYFKHLYNMAKSTKTELFVNYVQDMIDFTNVASLIRLKKQNKDIEFCKDVILENGNIKKDDILAAFNDSIDDMMDRFKDSKISNSLIKGLDSYKETSSLSILEKYKDDYLMDLNKASKYINIGPEPIFSYIVAKETEIKTLRIILVAKLNNLSPDVIRERVRELYV